MNMLYRFLERLFNFEDFTVEEPVITTESIREKIESNRKEEVERDKCIKENHAEIEEKLKLFPLGLPASITEIASSMDLFGLSVQIVLNKLTSKDDPEWNIVHVDGCTLYQKLR